MRRMAARTWLLVIERLADSCAVRPWERRWLRDSGLRAPLSRLRQQILELEREPFEVADLLLRGRRQEGVRDDAGDGDAEAHGGVVEGLGDALGQQGRP